jgi:hypothetical protein
MYFESHLKEKFKKLNSDHFPKREMKDSKYDYQLFSCSLDFL